VSNYAAGFFVDHHSGRPARALGAVRMTLATRLNFSQLANQTALIITA
jgi:N-formylglutamate amidohydrolase